LITIVIIVVVVELPDAGFAVGDQSVGVVGCADALEYF
jgi:hypothetical protein